MNERSLMDQYKNGHQQENIELYMRRMEQAKADMRASTGSIADAVAEVKARKEAMTLEERIAHDKQIAGLGKVNLELSALIDKDAVRNALKEQLELFIAEEAHIVKGLVANESKKQLAREVVHLRALVKTVKDAIKGIGEGAAPKFQHREAFAMMVYAKVEGPDDAPTTIRVWNSRDGVTPFVVNLGGAKYQHELGLMQMPFYDLPKDHQPTHKWVTRQDWEVMQAWQATVAEAVAQGKMTQEKADTVKDRMDIADGWHYRIGLVNLATGNYTDAETLKTAPAREVPNAD